MSTAVGREPDVSSLSGNPGRLLWRWQALVVAWLLAIAVGSYAMIQYESTPGQPAISAASWPTDTQLVLAPEGKTLVMFLHPQCPCSRASISELDRLLRQVQEPAKVYVLLVGGENLDSQESVNAREASSLPGVILWPDDDGTESEKFGSRTSGNLQIFNSLGKLVFDGGITSGRGHVGPSDAFDEAERAITASSSPLAHAPVFGCKLQSDNSQP